MEPLSNYLVLRVKRDLGDGATEVGASSIHRAPSTPRCWPDSLHRHAEAAGGDFITTWANHHYSLMGASRFGFLSAAQPQSILLTEESVRTYFGSDRIAGRGGRLFDDASFDRDVTSAVTGAVSRLAKDNATALGDGDQHPEPGFEVNDLSFMGAADLHLEQRQHRRNGRYPAHGTGRSLPTSVARRNNNSAVIAPISKARCR